MQDINWLQAFFGVIAIAISSIIINGSKKHDGLSPKFSARFIAVVLGAIGVFLLFSALPLIGFEQALALAFLTLFIGSIVSMGAAGKGATIGGLVAAIIFGIILASIVASLPVESFIRQFLTTIANGASHLWDQVEIWWENNT